jgi:DNA-binding NtrC family response regulator
MLRAGAQKFPVFSADVSTEWAYSRIHRESLSDGDLPAGTEVELSVRRVRDETGLVLPARVAWTHGGEWDSRGRDAIGVGLEVTSLPSAMQKHLQSLVRDQRPVVLAVDDEQENLELVERALHRDHLVVPCGSPEEAFEFLRNEHVAVLVCDQRMPDITGLELLTQVLEEFPYLQTKRIVLTAYPDLQEMQEFVNEGKVFHYLTKPVNVDDLHRVIHSAANSYMLEVENETMRIELQYANRQLTQENTSLRKQLRQIRPTDSLVGDGPALRKLVERLETVAPTDTTVLLRGETGTGKELLARRLHELSLRSEGPFVAVNCAAFPETLIESELFGYEAGAFTGATGAFAGRFERAHGGTVFIDEVGELSASTQVKLLRVLQNGQVERLGGKKAIQVDMRVVAATHRDLEAMMRQGDFREDLFYRLNVVPVYVPPLRERPEDVWPLVAHYLDLFQSRSNKEGITVSGATRELLESYEWPGNVRELVNMVERAVALTPSYGEADFSDLRQDSGTDGRKQARGTAVVGVPVGGTLREAVSGFERDFIQRTLEQLDGNRTRAAEQLGISRQALSQKIRKYGL